MSLVYHQVNLDDMPDTCMQELRTWFSVRIGTATISAHMPKVAGDTYALVQSTRSRMREWMPSVRVVADSNDRPQLFNRYMFLKLHTHMLKAVFLLVSDRGMSTHSWREESCETR